MGLRDWFKAYRTARQLEKGTLPTSGPEFEPVQGVDVERYALICKQLADANQQGQVTPAELDALLEREGVNPADWVKISETWNERVMSNLAVKMRYSEAFLKS